MKFLVYGTGGVGGYFGAKLARAGEHVRCVARGEHLRAMARDGLRVIATDGEYHIPASHVLRSLQECEPADVVLFCVKSYDTESAAELLAPVLADHSVVLSLQNGIDNEEKIGRLIDRGTVAAGAAYVSARITAPGTITETGGNQRIVFGRLASPPDERLRDIGLRMQAAGIRAEVREGMETELWKKFRFMSSMGSMTAATRLSQGEILESPVTLDLVFAAMKEVDDVARAGRIPLEPVSPQKVLESMRTFDPGMRSSMYYDLINGKPMEIEALNGTVARLGKTWGVPTPVHQTLYAILLPHHLRHQAGLLPAKT